MKTAENAYKEAVEIAENASKSVSDGELRFTAFRYVLQHLLSLKSEIKPKLKAKKPKAKKQKKRIRSFARAEI